MRAWVVAGSPGSRADCFRACLGSLTSRDTNAPCQSGTLIVAFPLLLQGRHPELSLFRGSIPTLHFPLSTLPQPPSQPPPTTRPRPRSLALSPLTLSSH